jgi:hypothetical protein
MGGETCRDERGEQQLRVCTFTGRDVELFSTRQETFEKDIVIIIVVIIIIIIRCQQ